MSEVSTTTESVFRILRGSLLSEEIFLPTDLDWSAIYQEMTVQTVSSLAGKWVKRSWMDEQQYKTWFLNTGKHVFHWNQVMTAQGELLSLFSEHQIPLVIMKGVAAGIYYPIPELRTMGDIDFIVSPDDFQTAAKLLEQNGYKLLEQASHHWEYRKNNISFEMHHYPAGVRPDDQELLELFYAGIEQRQFKTIKKYSFPVYPEVQNGLVLLLHIMYHLEAGLGLRQIIDWMMFANQCLDDNFYKKKFRPVVRQAGLEMLAITVTRMCQMYLGLTEDITWCKHADLDVCGALMRLVMQSGNFGRKEEKTVRIEKGISNRFKYYLHHPLYYFRTLQRDGKKRWKLITKYPWLTPFAWIYRLCYSTNHLFKVIKSGNFKGSMEQAVEKQALFKALMIDDRYFDS